MISTPLLWLSLTALGTAPLAEPAGTYVEARNASVFAGACHANGEYDHQGRAALLGWSIERGGWDGVDLSGVRLAAAVRADENLAEGGARRSLVWVDAPDAATRAAALAWLAAVQGERLGTVLATTPAPVVLRTPEGAYALEVAARLELRGRTRADRTCCSMPEAVWYAPLDDVGGRRVGWSARCRFAGAPGLAAWIHEDANNAFTGSFGPAGSRSAR